MESIASLNRHLRHRIRPPARGCIRLIGTTESRLSEKAAISIKLTESGNHHQQIPFSLAASATDVQTELDAANLQQSAPTGLPGREERVLRDGANLAAGRRVPRATIRLRPLGPPRRQTPGMARTYRRSAATYTFNVTITHNCDIRLQNGPRTQLVSSQ